ncbi:MAG: PIN domain-containing protein [Acidobacteriota bacterium]
MRGGDSFFVDTNVLLYSVDSSERRKREQAWQWLAQLWEQGNGRISWQVLHEFYANATRKMRLDSSRARAVVRGYAEWTPVEVTLGLVEQAWLWMDQAQLPYWDALIVAAAERAGSGWLLSEDFQDGRRFGSLTVLNPLLHHPGEYGLAGE